MDKLKMVPMLVACPDCGDANRAARRHCSTCNRKGKVVKCVLVKP